MKLHFGVLGPHSTTREQYQLGFKVGHCIAEADAILFCGGLDGMMRAAAEGAKSAKGQTVGILPSAEKKTANEFIDIAIPSDLGAYRNALLVRSCDAVIAVHGEYGTLSEITFALRLGIPVIGLNTWELSSNGKLDPGIHMTHTPEEAVARAIQLATKRQGQH